MRHKLVVETGRRKGACHRNGIFSPHTVFKRSLLLERTADSGTFIIIYYV